MKDLIIVPGAHKTGTTFLQNCLEQNLGALSHNNVKLITPSIFLESPLRWFLHQGVYGDSNIVSENEAIDSFNFLINRHPEGKTVLFVENLFGEALHGMWTPLQPNHQLYPHLEICANRLKDIVNKTIPIKIIYLVRRQDHLLNSLYSEFIRNGVDLPEEHFIRSLMGTDLRWGSLLLRIERIFDCKPKALPFEVIATGKDYYLSKFLSEVIGDSNISGWNLDVDENKSLRDSTISTALTTFKYISKDHRRLLVHKLEQILEGSGSKHSIFKSVFERSCFVQNYLRDNQKVIQEYTDLLNLQTFCEDQ